MLISVLCFGALIVACCSFADHAGQALGVIDHPDGVRKRHARPTPLVGGIALMFPLAAVTIGEAARWPAAAPLFGVLLVAGLGFTLLGWYDDRHQLSPALRLVTSTIICSVLLALEPGMRLTVLDFGFGPLPLYALALPFTVLCLVGFQNAVNMADGINGLVIGLSIFWTICLLLYAPPHLAIYLLFMLSGLIILLPFNISGRLFLGDAGSYSLSTCIGLLMIYVYNQANGLSMLTVVVWLAVPVMDCLRVMTMRLATTASPLTADRNHLHHRLSRHRPWRQAIGLYLLLVTVPGLIAALWPELTPAMLALIAAAYAGLIWHTRSRRAAAPRRIERRRRARRAMPHLGVLASPRVQSQDLARPALRRPEYESLRPHDHMGGFPNRRA